MPKIQPISREEATDEQRRVGDPIFEARGGAYRGPWGILLHNPELTEKAGIYGDYVRGGAGLPKRLSELVIAMTARNWRAQFEWAAHYHQGVAAGLDPDVLDAIGNRERPHFAQSDEQIVYDYVTELYANRGISDATHQRAVAEFGEAGIIGIVAIAGFYSSVALMCNAFDIEVSWPNPPPPLPE